MRLRYKKVSEAPIMESNAEIAKNSEVYHKKNMANNK